MEGPRKYCGLFQHTESIHIKTEAPRKWLWDKWRVPVESMNHVRTAPTHLRFPFKGRRGFTGALLEGDQRQAFPECCRTGFGSCLNIFCCCYDKVFSQKQLEEEKANFDSVAEVRVRRGGKSQLRRSVAAEHTVIIVSLDHK